MRTYGQSVRQSYQDSNVAYIDLQYVIADVYIIGQYGGIS